MNREIKLEFYVLNYDFNRDKIIRFNIFDNIRVYEASVAEVKKYLRAPSKYKYVSFDKTVTLTGFDAFVEKIRRIVMWEEWARSEYEISAGYAFETDVSKLEKVDCYYQFEPNKEIVANYIITQYKKWLKEKREKSNG